MIIHNSKTNHVTFEVGDSVVSNNERWWFHVDTIGWVGMKRSLSGWITDRETCEPYYWHRDAKGTITFSEDTPKYAVRIIRETLAWDR